MKLITSFGTFCFLIPILYINKHISSKNYHTTDLLMAQSNHKNAAVTIECAINLGQNLEIFHGKIASVQSQEIKIGGWYLYGKLVGILMRLIIYQKKRFATMFSFWVLYFNKVVFYN